MNTVYVGSNALTNSKAIGGLLFEKVDEKDSAIKLGATFEIHKKSDDSLVRTVTTGTDGKCEVTDLEVGDYYLVETVAPSGYKLDSTHHDFTITQDKTNTVYVGSNAIKNTKNIGSISNLPNTGSNSIAIGLFMLLLGAGSIVMVINRKRKLKEK